MATEVSMVQPIPPDRPGVIPYLTVEGAASAITWYGTVFGATSGSTTPSADGRLVHAELRVGEGLVFVADDFPETNDGQGASPWAVGGSPVTLHHYVRDVDATVEVAVAEGATLLFGPVEMFWGDRFAKIQDPFGHLWSLATHVRDVTEEEQAAAAAELGTG
ncbi:MAG: VOC family protein [Acidimicrobiales bacterium]